MSRVTHRALNFLFSKFLCKQSCAPPGGEGRLSLAACRPEGCGRSSPSSTQPFVFRSESVFPWRAGPLHALRPGLVLLKPLGSRLWSTLLLGDHMGFNMASFCQFTEMLSEWPAHHMPWGTAHICTINSGEGGMWVPPSHFPVGLDHHQCLLCGYGEVRPGGGVEERGQSPGLLFGVCPWPLWPGCIKECPSHWPRCPRRGPHEVSQRPRGHSARPAGTFRLGTEQDGTVSWSWRAGVWLPPGGDRQTGPHPPAMSECAHTDLLGSSTRETSKERCEKEAVWGPWSVLFWRLWIAPLSTPPRSCKLKASEMRID